MIDLLVKKQETAIVVGGLNFQPQEASSSALVGYARLVGWQGVPNLEALATAQSEQQHTPWDHHGDSGEVPPPLMCAVQLLHGPYLSFDEVPPTALAGYELRLLHAPLPSELEGEVGRRSPLRPAQIRFRRLQLVPDSWKGLASGPDEFSLARLVVWPASVFSQCLWRVSSSASSGHSFSRMKMYSSVGKPSVLPSLILIFHPNALAIRL